MLKKDQILWQSVNNLEEQFFAFIESEKRNLNEETIFQILQSHCRMNDYCLRLAKTFANYETALVMHSMNRQEYSDALATIQGLPDPEVRYDLILRYGAILIAAEPMKYLHLLQMEEQRDIDKRRLIPILL